MRWPIIVALLLFALPGRSEGAIALVSGQTCSVNGQIDTAATCTLPGNTTAGSLLVCAVGWAAAGGTLDSILHNSVEGTQEAVNADSTSSVKLVYWPNIPGGAATIIPDLSSSTPLMYLSCGEFSAAATSTPRDQFRNDTDLAGTTAVSHGSITPSEDNTMVWAAIKTAANETVSVAPSCGTRIGSQVRFFAYYCIQTTATATDMAWTAVNNLDAPSTIANFKQAAAAGGGGAPRGAILTLGVGPGE